MLFEDMKKFYMTIGFLDEFNNRGFSVSYPEDDFYVTNHLNYLTNLADKYNVDDVIFTKNDIESFIVDGTECNFV